MLKTLFILRYLAQGKLPDVQANTNKINNYKYKYIFQWGQRIIPAVKISGLNRLADFTSTQFSDDCEIWGFESCLVLLFELESIEVIIISSLFPEHKEGMFALLSLFWTTHSVNERSFNVETGKSGIKVSVSEISMLCCLQLSFVSSFLWIIFWNRKKS